MRSKLYIEDSFLEAEVFQGESRQLAIAVLGKIAAMFSSISLHAAANRHKPPESFPIEACVMAVTMIWEGDETQEQIIDALFNLEEAGVLTIGSGPLHEVKLHPTAVKVEWDASRDVTRDVTLPQHDVAVARRTS